MQSKNIKVFAFLIASLLLMQCDPAGPNFPAGNVRGYRPVYASESEKTIAFITRQPVQNPGKIYIYNQYLLLNETGKGIHIFDNSDPASPQPLGFLKINGNVDMVLKGSVLYVDHIGSLVALNIADLHNIKELSRFKTWTEDFPPQRGYYFQCVDPEKGEVIGWEEAALNNPECYR